MAVLRVLEKGPARAYTIEAPVGAETEVGPLSIRINRCWEPPPEDVPESAAYLVIRERGRTADDDAVDVFRGWMFASSPSLSALEHPTHDVWMLDCRTSVSTAGPETDAGDEVAP